MKDQPAKNYFDLLQEALIRAARANGFTPIRRKPLDIEELYPSNDVNEPEHRDFMQEVSDFWDEYNDVETIDKDSLMEVENE